MVKVANPIYDVVFKYLMEDKRVAKLLISALLDLEVLEIELKPSEYSVPIKKQELTVYRIDFKARIKDKDGKEQLVLIELQKAKLPTDIMRFRRYLGMQYAHKDNVVAEPKAKYALPIISIYFLGYPLENFKDVPIIRVARQYINHATKEILKGKEYFIESLTHDSVIVQIQAIQNKKHRNKLEQVLSVFDQSKVHEVMIDENKYPPEYHEIMRRLTLALANPEVREIMNIEDDIIEELTERERRIQDLAQEKIDAIQREFEAKKQLQQAKQREQKAKQREQEAKQREQEAKQREQEAKQREQEAKQREQEAKQREQEVQALINKERKEKEKTKQKLAKMMKESGKSTDEIINETGLSAKEIDKL